MERDAENMGVVPGMKPLRVAEVFGPTIQGEGPHSGTRAAFVRLWGCNLSCEWCDTPYTWDTTRYSRDAESRDMTPDDVARAVELLGVKDGDASIILTGGEPMLQHHRIPGLVDALVSRCGPVAVDIETNGTVSPSKLVGVSGVNWVVSPKLITKSDPVAKRLKQKAILDYAVLARSQRAWFKFVCATAADVETVHRFVTDYAIPRFAVWVMPEGQTTTELAATFPRIADAAVKHRFNVSHRLHVLAWGTERMK